MPSTATPKKPHEGFNLKRIREILHIKQEALAFELGDDWSQKRISILESKETIEPALLEQVAKALKVPVEAIKNFDEDAAMANIACHFSDNAVAFQFNPLDKIIELYESKIELYERMLKEKDALIEKLIAKK